VPDAGRAARASRRERAVLPLLSVAAALAVTAPLLRPGTVLANDMVFVPHQPWRDEWLGLGSALPRAVPADAVVSLATGLVDGAVLQKAVLVLVLALAALGAGRVVPARGVVGRVAAAAVYVWNPFVAERLLLGQWTVLVAHAALPWVLAGALDVRAGRRGGAARTLVAVAAASLTASGGVLAAALAVACAGRSRRAAAVAAGALVLQLPWLLPGLLHPGGAASDPSAVDAFATRAENWSGTVGSVLALGGVWNAQAVPGSRTSVLAPVLAAGLLVLAGLGLRPLAARWGRPATLGLVAVAGAGLALALLGAVPATAGLLRAVVEAVPGAGLLRDGHKWLAPLALLYGVAAGLGVERLAAVPARRALAAGALLLPLAGLPDLAWGVGGRLEPVAWPDDWAVVRERLASDPAPGSLVSVPFSAYRAYAWNGGRPSLDPAARWFDEEVVVEDRLLVGDTVVEGEDVRARQVRSALAEQRPLGEVGVRWVLVQHRTPGEVPASATAGARPVHQGPDLSLYRLPSVREVEAPSPPAVPVLLGVGAALAVLGTSVAGALSAALRAGSGAASGGSPGRNAQSTADRA
jgi:hypothetical protein